MAEVFVSYSRRDSEIAARICDALVRRGKPVFIDLGEGLLRDGQRPAAADERSRAEVAGIALAAPWMEEIRSAIAAADTVLVLVSPESCASPVCRAELGYASSLNKRLVPVQVRDTPAEALPGAVAVLNMLSISSGEGFEAAVDQLAAVLDTDIDGLRLHTRLTVRAREWDSDSGDRSRLLRGKELTTAERWLAEQPGRNPAPTLTQTAYILASRAAATRRQRALIATAAAAVVVVTGLGSAAGLEWRSADAQRQTAVAQRDVAVSRVLSADSGAEVGPDPPLAALLAAAAWRVAPTGQARYSLLNSIAQPERGTLAVYPSGIVTALAVDPQRKILAAGYQGGLVRVWDIGSHRLLHATAWDPTLDGLPFAGNTVIALAFTHGGRSLEVAFFGAVGVWDLAGRAGITVRQIPGDHGLAAAFSPDGAVLADTRGAAVQLWDASTLRHIATATTAAVAPGSMAFSPDGTMLATGTGDGTAELWDARRRLQAGTGMNAGTGPVAVAFSPDGETLATGTGGGTIRLWNTRTHRREGPAITAGGPVTSLAFSDGGTMLAAAERDGTVHMWNTATHAQAGPPLNAPGTVTSSLISIPGSGLLATGGGDGTIRLWQPALLQQASAPLPISRPIQGVMGGGPAVFSANGEFLATDGYSNVIQVWDLATRRHTGVPVHGPPDDSAFAVSPDGTILATIGSGVQLWDTSTGKPIGKPIGGPDADGASFTAGSKLLAIDSKDGSTRLWDIATRHPAGHAEQGGLFSPDGNIIADVTGTSDVQLRDAATQVKIGSPVTAGTQPGPLIMFSPDGTVLVTADGDGTTRLWDTATQQEIGAPITAGTTPVYAIGFSPGRTMLATGYDDGTIRLWDVATQQEIGTPMTADTNPVYALSFSPDGALLETASTDGTARFWDIAFPRNLPAAACAIAGQSLTPQQWAQYTGIQPFQQVCPGNHN